MNNINNKTISEKQLKAVSDIRPGDTVRIHQIIKETAVSKKGEPEEKKEKIQTFEGIVLARKHGKEMGATITIRRAISGIGVEKIFPIHSPVIKEIELVKRGKTRRAKLYYLREAKGKRGKLKTKDFKAGLAKDLKIPGENEVLSENPNVL